MQPPPGVLARTQVTYVADIEIELDAHHGSAEPDGNDALVALLRTAPVLLVTNVLFSQGINEMQSLANLSQLPGISSSASLLGDHSIQRDINNESLAKLRTFFRQALATVAALEPPLVAPAWDVPELEQQLRQIEETVAHASNTKNVHILQLTAAFCRSLGGARVV